MNYYRFMDNSKIQFDFLITDYKKNYYEDEAISLGARVFRRPMRTRNPLGNALSLIRLLRGHPEIKIIHIHHHTSVIGIDALIALLCGVKVRIAHSRSHLSSVSILQHIFRPLLRATATHWLGCSMDAGIYMFGKAAKNDDRFKVLPNARNLNEFVFNADIREKTRESLKLSDNFVAINIGRIDFPKNQTFLLDVTAKIVPVLPSFVLLIAGGGELKKSLEEKVSALGIEKNVRFLGLCNNVPELLQAADIFLFPSLHEGLGTVSIEAQTAGLVCLISDTVPSSCKVTELVEFLPINEGPEIWAKRILSFQDGYLRRNMKEAVRRSGYDIVSAAPQLEQFYIDALTRACNRA